MVAIASGQAVPQTATLDFLSQPNAAKGIRLQGEFYVPASALSNLGWSYAVSAGKQAVVTREGTIEVVARTLDGKTHIPIRSLCESLGAAVEWTADGTTLVVRGVIRRLEVQATSLQVDATMDGWFETKIADKPRRAMLDLVGFKLTPATQIVIAPGTRAVQFDNRLVRIIHEGKVLPQEGRIALRGSIHQDWSTSPRETEKPLTYEQMVAGTQLPIMSLEDVGAFTPVSLRQSLNLSGPVRLVNETPRSSLLSVGLPVALAAPARFSRPEAQVVEMFLPGTRVPPGGKLDSKLVESVESEEVPGGTTLRLRLSRPLGVELSQTGKQLQFLLTVPKNQDGRIAGKIIVVDAGHGAHDSGAKDPTKSVFEKDLNLAISKFLAQKLADMGATVIMTRKTDTFIALRERAEIANRNRADLFVSVHINSNKNNNSTSGSIIFYHGKDPIGQLLADCVRVETAKTGKLRSIGTWSDTRIYDTGFAVLRYSKMPGILVETGFINHSKDLSVMRSAAFQEEYAAAIARGIKVFFSDGK